MKLLLDTHALLWWLADDERLGPRAREPIEDPGNDVLVGVVSLWEMVVKVRVGKLEADVEEIAAAVRRDGFTPSTSASRTSGGRRSCRCTTVTLSITCSSRKRS